MRKIAQMVILAALALTVLTSCETAGLVSSESSQLWAHTPSWSPDGSSIVMHMSGARARGDFPLGDVALGEVSSDGSWIRLISEALPSADYELDFSPDLSPDGSRIVFMTYRFKTRQLRLLFFGVVNSEIVTSALDGSDVRRLTKNDWFDHSPVWSPDGASIAFISRGTLHTMRADGSQMRELTDTAVSLGDPPIWSPDGEYIAFTAVESEGQHRSRYALYTVTRQGSEVYRVSETVIQGVPPRSRVMTSRPAWSPGGGQLAFAKKDGDSAGIYTSNPDGSNMRLVLPDVEAVHLAWSPDGAEIAFVAEGVVSGVRPDGSGLRRLSLPNLSGVIQGLSWSPDGSRLAVSGEFRAEGERRWSLLVMDSNSGDTRVLAGNSPWPGVRAVGGQRSE